jgi:hypothetical protein
LFRHASRWIFYEEGVSVIEVIAAVALLILVAIPMLDFTGTTHAAVPLARQDAVSLATSKVEELESQAYRTQSSPVPSWPSSGSDTPPSVGRYAYQRTWSVGPYTPANNDNPTEISKLRVVSVTVTCLNCAKPMPPVKVVAIIEKLT